VTTIASVGSQAQVQFFSKAQDKTEAQAATGPIIGLAKINTPSAPDVAKTAQTVNSDGTVGPHHKPKAHKLPGSFHV
jgi:hypothetical protein